MMKETATRVIKTIRAGEWLIAEGSIPAYFLYRMTKGRVGIYEENKKIASVEVGEGDKSHYIGFLSSLSEDRKHRASVKTETEIEVEVISTDHIQGLLRHDIPAGMRADIDMMIETIQIGDRIKGLRRIMSEKPIVDFDIESDTHMELKEILEELKSVYERIVKDPECRG